MALLNKIFFTRKQCSNKHDDNVCEKLFSICTNQVRVVLFRECDYRGRKLLFDSQTVEKVTIPKETPKDQLTEKLYMEVNNGCGFKLNKPSSDAKLLSEMIFGTVAMSYQGASLKIHSLQNPARIMYTQIFPTPKHFSRNLKSASHNTCSSTTSTHSLDCSFHFDDSGACSSNSISDNSVHSAYSDTVLICRSSITSPLDVPKTASYNYKTLNPNTAVDSGIDGFHLGSSLGGEASSAPLYVFNRGSELTFSCGSLYKRFLRSTSTSLEHSRNSLNGSASAEECVLKPHSRNSKLGVAIIIELSKGQEESLECFLLEHAAIIEAMIWSACQMVETAYTRYQNFLSIMHQLTGKVANWLVDFLSGPRLHMNMWINLSSVCDNHFSIHSDSSVIMSDEIKRTDNENTLKNKCICDNFVYANEHPKDILDNRTLELSIFNWTNFFKYDWNSSNLRSEFCQKNSALAEQFLNDFCELLESVDVKDTKFFISTLVTAILTHHLGWVATVFPASSEETTEFKKLQYPSNALWGQLIDLYGAIGYPTKVSHTVISGTNKEDLITKILNSLSYFIRCSDIEKRTLVRNDIKAENEEADRICKKRSFIPKQNYKKYQDHIKEIETNSEECFKTLKTTKDDLCSLGNNNKFEGTEMRDFNKLNKENLNPEMKSIEFSSTKKQIGLTKSHTCLTNLNQLTSDMTKDTSNSKNCFDNETHLTKDNNCNNKETIETSENTKAFDKKPNLMEKIKSLGIEAINLSNTSCSNLSEKLNEMKKSTAALAYQSNVSNQLLTTNEAAEGIQKIFSHKMHANKPHTYSVNELKQSNSLKRCKTKACLDVCTSDAKENIPKPSLENILKPSPEKEVVFVLGDDEQLVGIKRNISNRNLTKSNSEVESVKNLDSSQEKSINNNDNMKTSSKLNLENDDFFNNSQFKDSDFIKYEGKGGIKPSCSYASFKTTYKKQTNSEHQNQDTFPENETKTLSSKKDFTRSQSVPPEDKKTNNNREQSRTRYRYSGVKFNFQQYPQIVENYLKSKNLEMSHLPFIKNVTTLLDERKFDFSLYDDNDDEELETLQTPSNASDLVSFSELSDGPRRSSQSCSSSQKLKTSVKNEVQIEKQDVKQNILKEKDIMNTSIDEHPLNISNKSNNAMFEHEETNSSREESPSKTSKTQLELIELPMPKSIFLPQHNPFPFGYTSTLMRGIGKSYVSNMVLQGTSAPKAEWESSLKQDLVRCTRHPLVDQPVDEAVAIVANTDTWDVQLLSSHTYIVDKGTSGVRVGMSQLVSNMLESLLHLWKIHTSPENCLVHIEQKLQEFCILSKALAQLLLATEFCSMEFLTSTLHLEVNDVPLLMAVASTHTPQVTEKYGLSFQ